MDDILKKYLTDVILAVENIDTHLQHKRDYALFENNITIRSAIKYEFAIIGEAIYELQKLKADVQITDARKIIGLRNKVVHDYDAIDNAQVWAIIINYLPGLESEVRTLLSQ